MPSVSGRLSVLHLLVAALAVLAFGNALGQGFHSGSREVALELLADFSRVETEWFGRTITGENGSVEQRLRYRNANAYLLDPRFFTFTVGGTLGLSRESSAAEAPGSSVREARDGTLLGYDLVASLLPGQSLSLNVFANRNDFSLAREFAGRTEVRAESRGATLYANRLFVPSVLTFRHERDDEESRTREVVTRRRERRDVLTYEGRRGFLDSELGLRYEVTRKTDALRAELDSDTYDGSLRYSRDFGPERNRRWDAWLRTFRRSGFREETRSDLEQLLQIEHGPRLRSQLRYSLQRAERPEGVTDRRSGSLTVSHRLYDSLLTEAGLYATVERPPEGERDLARGQLRFDYTKRLPGNGRLNAGLSGDYEREDDRFEAASTLVVGESHTFATPFALAVPLDRPRVVVSSVEVVKTAAGPPVPGCGAFSLPRPLTEGVDFTLRPLGERTEIVPLPCTAASPGINPGDTVVVDYTFTVSPELSFTTRAWRAAVALDYGWIRPFLVHDQRRQDLVAGLDGEFLDDLTSDTVGVELRRARPGMRASLLAQAERLVSGDQSYETVRANQFVMRALGPGLSLTVSGEQAFTEFTLPQKRDTRILTGRMTLSYPFGGGLFTDLYASVRALDDTLVADERTSEAGLNARWVHGRLEVIPSAKFIDRRRARTRARDYRAVLRVVRVF